jgi:putative peptidoglycan lipid II flippase
VVLLAGGGDIGGLAIAFSIANSAEALLLAIVLGRMLPGIWQAPGLWQRVLYALVASIVIGLGWWYGREFIPGATPSAVYHWPDDLISLLVGLVGLGGIGIAFYVLFHEVGKRRDK